MRIFLFLLTPFIAIVASAQTKVDSADQLTADKTYTIYNPHFTAYAISSPDDHATYVWAAEMTGDEGHAIKNDSYSQTLDSNSPYSAWMVVEYDGAMYVYNVGAQKFLVVGVTGGTQATTLQDQPQPVSISDDGNGNFTFITTEGLRNYMCAAPQMDYPISVWSSDDAGAQWEITESTVPADYETCIALLKARMGMENEDYELVFSDEFNGEGEPNADYWVRTPRASSTWNRWCSDDSRVVYEQGGTLHCLAIPTPDDSDDTAPMLTGGIKSQGMFTFQYGRAVARIKTNQWRGNFPAFWMMPADNSAGWPNAGEIDIWETIDTSTQSWHTVHTNWTYNLHQGTNSQNYNNIDYNLWHTYAVDWDSQAITWYVDGNKVWSYTKSTDTNALDNGQWPFDAPFYLILNQSVGNGSWAANADTNHTYETLFDWVRVYQPKDATGIQSSRVQEVQKVKSQESIVYDLSGRKVNGQPKKGIYIVGGKKVLR